MVEIQLNFYRISIVFLLYFYLFSIVFPILAGNYFPGNNDLHPSDSGATCNKTKVKVIAASHIALYGSTVVLLNNLWYSQYPRTGFHFFDDSHEWLQMDKAAHVFDVYQLSRLAAWSFRCTGMPAKRAALWGSVSGTTYLTAVELLDGFSAGWGFSLSDMAANLAGACMYYGQEAWWKDQRITLKFSFHRTDYYPYRPELLGSTLGENIFKDYNGQTLWLSANVPSFTGSQNKFLRIINVAVGYGASGMLGGEANPLARNGVPLPQYDRYRRVLLSLDIDWTRIPVKSRALKTVFEILNCIKLPFPALEINTINHVKFFGSYF